MQSGDSYKVTKTTTFIAQWKMPITFDPNGGKLNGKTSPKVVEYNPGDAVKIIAPPTREGYIFKEWNTKKDGSGKAYKSGAVCKTSKATTFYAIWEKIPTLTYDPTGGTFRGSEDPTTVQYKPGDPVTIAEAAVREHYVFKGWLVRYDGREEILQPGKKRLFPGDVQFSALWEKDKHKINYDPNGGIFRGTTAVTTIEYDCQEVINIAEAPTREGYTFLYWMGSEYQPGDTYTVEDDHTFVAQWEKNEEPDKPNKGKKHSEEEESAETGDMFMPGLWMLLMLASLLMAYSIWRRRQEQELSRR